MGLLHKIIFLLLIKIIIVFTTVDETSNAMNEASKITMTEVTFHSKAMSQISNINF